MGAPKPYTIRDECKPHYHCAACKKSGVRLYRVRFADITFCKKCAEKYHPSKEFQSPRGMVDGENLVAAIPYYFENNKKRNEHHSCILPPIDQIDWWESMPEYLNTNVLATIKRIWV